MAHNRQQDNAFEATYKSTLEVLIDQMRENSQLESWRFVEEVRLVAALCVLHRKHFGQRDLSKPANLAVRHTAGRPTRLHGRLLCGKRRLAG
jgi:hypothetical protein